VVILGADPGSGVGSRDVRNGEVGIANGRGANGFGFVPLNPEADIRVGDRLVTGPAGSTSFVAGLSVGTVSSVRRSADGITRADIAPATSATRLDLVAVILVGGEPAAPRQPIDPSAAVAQR
jgi:rod shape-determining protein MreC